MVAVPALTPESIPEAEPIEATPLVEELHAPPGIGSLSETEEPIHTIPGPDMGAAGGVVNIVT